MIRREELPEGVESRTLSWIVPQRLCAWSTTVKAGSRLHAQPSRPRCRRKQGCNHSRCAPCER